MNYYKTLGLSSNASSEDIKNSYKKLAMKYHPDKNKGSIEAEEKFKEITNAYKVLSSPDQRKMYDLTGSTNMANADMSMAFNLFNNIFSSFTSNFMDNIREFSDDSVYVEVLYNQPQKEPVTIAEKTDDIYYNINAELEDIYSRMVKKLTVSQYRRQTNGSYKKVPVKLKIPLHYSNTIFPGESDELEGYLLRGDIIVNVNAKPHDYFQRVGEFDLLTTHSISLVELQSKEFLYTIKHLDERELHLKTYNLLEQRHLFQKVPGEGLYIYDEDRRGDLYIYFTLNFNEESAPIDEEKGIEFIETQKCELFNIFTKII